TSQMWAIVRRSNSAIDIDLCDDDGRVAVSFEGFETRKSGSDGTREAMAASNPPARVSAPGENVLAALTTIAARILEVDPDELDLNTEFGDFGFDSVSMTGLASRINAELGSALTPADFYEFGTLSRLAR